MPQSNPIIELLLQSEKARRGGGRGGPGSRGGKFFINAQGHVEYGAKPSGSGRVAAAKPQTAVRTGRGGGSGRAVHGELRAGYRIKKPTSGQKTQAKRRMLSEMDKAIKSGKDPHGNKLSSRSVEQLRFLATGLRTEIRMTSSKATEEVKAEIATREVTAQPFMAYKDLSGRYRWVIRSGSSYEDRDGETTSQKALEQAVDRLNATGKFGELDWWHTTKQLGTCDFSAMHGRVLVESGTFVNEAVGQRIAEAVANKEFTPGVSLMFSHDEPGPQVLPGRVFKNIEIIRRALLDEHIASNRLTGGEIINLASKEVNKRMDEKKEQRLRDLLGPDTFDAFMQGNDIAEKAIQVAGFSYKSLTPEPVAAVVEIPNAPVEPPVVVTLPAVNPVAETVELSAPVEVVATEEETPLELDTEAIFGDFFARIKTEILAAIPSVAQEQPVATKELTDLLTAQTVALKENTTAMNSVVAENVALKERLVGVETRLAALDGSQPAAVRARASQQNGVPLDGLSPSQKELVNPSTPEVNPYEQIAQQLGLSRAPGR